MRLELSQKKKSMSKKKFKGPIVRSLNVMNNRKENDFLLLQEQTEENCYCLLQEDKEICRQMLNVLSEREIIEERKRTSSAYA